MGLSESREKGGTASKINLSDEHETTSKSLDEVLLKSELIKLEVTLDPETAHRDLVLSDNRKEVRYDIMNQMEYLAGPKRFDDQRPCVLGVQGFEAQSFYYEVEVKVEVKEGREDWWSVGVAEESVNRKEFTYFRPEHGYWNIEKESGTHKYYACTSPRVPITWIDKLKKVGVFVDYEQKQVSFFDAENKSHIFTFPDCKFTGKLFPILYIYSTDSVSSTLFVL